MPKIERNDFIRWLHHGEDATYPVTGTLLAAVGAPVWLRRSPGGVEDGGTLAGSARQEAAGPEETGGEPEGG